MKAISTQLDGCYILEPTVYNDNRGYFFESYNKERYESLIGRRIDFVQDNRSFSTYGVLRGIHFQNGEHAQAKLVSVLSGKVLDVAVDLRPDSETYGMHESVILSSENKLQFFIPRGFGHAFVVLSETAEFYYKCDNYYNKASEGGILYNDPALNIDWQVPNSKLIVSEKDKELRNLG